MKKKILIVDDDPILRDVLSDSLESVGHIICAEDGHQALKIYMEDNIDLDGYQTLSYIKSDKNLKDIKVVFLTAKNKASDIEKGLNLGADKYLTKPFSVKKIVSEIMELVA